MDFVLVLREEAVCLVMLLFLLYTWKLYNMGKDKKRFLRLTLTALFHCAMDAVTVWTANRFTGSPVNDILHQMYNLSELLFCCEVVSYVAALCYCEKTARRFVVGCFSLMAAYLISIPFYPAVEQVKYGRVFINRGLSSTVAFSAGFVLLAVSFASVLLNVKQLDKHVRLTLLPVLGFLLGMEIAQMLKPGLMLTGAACTLAAMGIFFSLESPVYVFKKKLMVDALTGVKSRHAYEEDIVKFETEYQKGSRFCVTFFDINDLKAVNDIHGHMEGDIYISTVASTLLTRLTSALNVYRMGGDEFMAIFRDVDDDEIAKEIESVNQGCREACAGKNYRMSVAAGCAVATSNDTTLKDVLRTADYMMYENKVRQKRLRAYELFENGKISREGLSDRIFNAFAGIENNRFYFVSNLTTNVTRWSVAAVSMFALPDEYIFDFTNMWLPRIHPDDAPAYMEDLNAVLSGARMFHSAAFRAKNKDGEYVELVCNGTLLKGRGTEPDLFAGVMRLK